MAVDLRPQVIDQAFTDSGRIPPVDERQDPVKEREPSDKEREPEDETGPPGEGRVGPDPVVDDLLEHQGRRDRDDRVNDDDDKKGNQLALVRRRETGNALDRPRRQLLLCHCRIARKRTHCLPGSARSRSHLAHPLGR